MAFLRYEKNVQPSGLFSGNNSHKVQSSIGDRDVGLSVVVFTLAFPALYQTSAAIGLRSPPPQF